MKIAMASDHGGLELKETVKAHLKELGHDVEDFGTYTKESCHYPVFAAKAAHAVAEGECELGVVICTTGVGVSMVANKVKGVRCALCSDCYSAEMTRRHNNANMLAMGQNVVGAGLALKIVDAFLSHTFEGGRHATRVDMISAVERGEL